MKTLQSLIAENNSLREEVADAIIRAGFATGHGDTVKEMLDEMVEQVNNMQTRAEQAERELASAKESYDEQNELLVTIQEGYVRKEKSESRLLKEVYEGKARVEELERELAAEKEESQTARLALIKEAKMTTLISSKCDELAAKVEKVREWANRTENYLSGTGFLDELKQILKESR